MRHKYPSIYLKFNKSPELDRMLRRIQEIKTQMDQIPSVLPPSEDAADKLAEKLKALAEEGVFLDGLFSPLNQEEGPEAWLERVAKSMEQLSAKTPSKPK